VSRDLLVQATPKVLHELIPGFEPLSLDVRKFESFLVVNVIDEKLSYVPVGDTVDCNSLVETYRRQIERCSPRIMRCSNEQTLSDLRSTSESWVDLVWREDRWT
jgi:hypothetical protein